MQGRDVAEQRLMVKEDRAVDLAKIGASNEKEGVRREGGKATKTGKEASSIRQ